jgi:hypothetical protein
MKHLNWTELNEQISGMTEKQVWKLIEAELTSLCRASHLTRLHQRYCKLRDARERSEILSGAK